MKARNFALLLCLAAATYSAHADTITSFTSTPTGANDSVNYGQIPGGDGTGIGSSVSLTSSNGVAVTMSYAPGGYAVLCDQSGATCNDALPQSYSMGVYGSSITYTFGTPVGGFGTTIEDTGSQGANIAATLMLYDGTTLLGTVTEAAPDGNQIYIGATEAGADITSAVIGITGDPIVNTTTTRVMTGFTLANPTTTYVGYVGAAGYSDAAFCNSITGASGFGAPGSTTWFHYVLNCPSKADSYGVYDFASSGLLALPAGFCPADSGCSHGGLIFQQGIQEPLYETVYNTTTTPFASSYQLDSLDIVDAPATAPSVTPEPSSLALLGTGVLSVAGFVRRRLVKSA